MDIATCQRIGPFCPKTNFREMRLGSSLQLKKKVEGDHNFQPEHYNNLAFKERIQHQGSLWVKK